MARLALGLTLVAAALVWSVAQPRGSQSTPTARALNAVNILFDRPGAIPVFGPNEVVEITAGNINYVGGRTNPFEKATERCTQPVVPGGIARVRPGIDDVLQPFADIYIVPAGQQPVNTERLVDVQGAPNTVFGGLGGSFLFEPLGLTFPTGKISAGVYGIVVDECQNGYFDTGEDTFIDDAFWVDLDQDVPPLSASAQAFLTLKERSTTLDRSLRTVEELIKFKDAYEKVKEAQPPIAPTPDAMVTFVINQAVSAIQNASLYAEAKQRVNDSIKTMIAQHITRARRLAADPPQLTFDLPATPITTGIYANESNDEIVSAFSIWFAHVDALSALTGMLLDAVERYQGADQLGDAAWAHRHAVTIDELRELYDEVLSGFDDAHTDLVATLTGRPFSDVLFLDRAVRHTENAIKGLGSEVGFTGPSIEVQREVLNNGGDPAFVAMRKADWEAKQNGLDRPLQWGLWITTANELADALRGFGAALPDFEALAQSLITPLTAELGPSLDDPAISIAVVGTASAGATVQLTSGIVDPAATVSWDLDADGDDDDGTGASIDWVVPGDAQVGAPLFVSADVVTPTGRSSATHVVTVQPGGNQRPQITDATVDGGVPSIADVTPGGSVALAVTANDPDGDPLTYEWFVNGIEQTTTTSTFTITTAADRLDTYWVEVLVSDGEARTRQGFMIRARSVDLDGDNYLGAPGADCLDDPAAAPSGGPTAFSVNPSQPDIANGVDDDCNGFVDDAPPGFAGPPDLRLAPDSTAKIENRFTEISLVELRTNWDHPNRRSGDTFRLTVDWGDGDVDTLDLAFDAGLGTFDGGTRPAFTHSWDDQYRDVRVEFCWEWLDDPAPDPTTGNERRCAARIFQAYNERPLVNGADFREWTPDQFGGSLQGSGTTGIAIPYNGSFEDVDATGRRVQSEGNPGNLVIRTSPELLGEFGYGRAYIDQHQPTRSDNDIVGVLFGYDPTVDGVPGGDPEGEFFSVDPGGIDPTAEAIAVTWSNDTDSNLVGRFTQSYCNDAVGGPIPVPDPFQIWRMRGNVGDWELFFRTTFDVPEDVTNGNPPQDAECSDGPGNGIEVLASVPTTEDRDVFRTADVWTARGWPDEETLTGDPYLVEYDYQPRSLTVWVDGVEQLRYDVPDGEPDLPPSRLSIVTWSVPEIQIGASAGPTPVFDFVQGKGGEFDSLMADGSPVPADGITMSMSDGADDTHEARIDWGDDTATTDGTVVPDAARGLGWFTISGDHIYERAGRFVGEVCAADDEGLRSCHPFIADVSNRPPVVMAGSDRVVPTTFELTDATFQDPGAFDTHTATIDWGDGTTDPGTVVADRGGGTVSGTHTYGADGDYVITICVRDQFDAEACDDRTVEVRATNQPPTLGALTNANLDEGGAVSFGFGFEDPNVDDEISSTVDWADGTAVESAVLDQVASGCVDIDPDPVAVDVDCQLVGSATTPEHVFTDDGLFETEVEVCDRAGACARERLSFTVSNVEPSLSVETPSVDGAMVELAGEFDDPGDDTVVIAVDWGDGTVESASGGLGALLRSPIVRADSGRFDATHTYATAGSKTIEVCADDGDGGRTCLTRSVTVSAQSAPTSSTPTMSPPPVTTAPGAPTPTTPATNPPVPEPPATDPVDVLPQTGGSDASPVLRLAGLALALGVVITVVAGGRRRGSATNRNRGT